MFVQDVENDLYTVGLKLDYDPKRLDFNSDLFNKDDVKTLACGQRHYMAVTNNNDLAIWGNVLADASDHQDQGFNLYSGDKYFDDGQIEHLEVKYSIFGAIVKH